MEAPDGEAADELLEDPAPDDASAPPPRGAPFPASDRGPQPLDFILPFPLNPRAMAVSSVFRWVRVAWAVLGIALALLLIVWIAVLWVQTGA